MELEVLPGGDVSLAQRCEALRQLPEGVHLVRRHPAEGELHARHLHVWLALAVHTLLQPVALENRLFLVAARQEARRFGLKVVELLGQDRQHLAGSVGLDDSLDCAHLQLSFRGRPFGPGHRGLEVCEATVACRDAPQSVAGKSRC